MSNKNNDAATEQNVWVGRLLPIGVLCAICLVATALLAATNELTAPVIEQNRVAAAQNQQLAIFSEADAFNLMELPASVTQQQLATEVYSAHVGEDVVGYLVSTSTAGYGGQVPVIVAFDTERTVKTVSIQSHSETPGLGDRVSEPDFLAQFTGRTQATDDFQAITGATISSKSVNESINKAVDTINAVLGVE